MFLLDTNVLSELMDGAEGAEEVRTWARSVDPETIFISAITAAEIRYGVALMPAGKRKNAKTAAAEKIISLYSESGRCLSFDEKTSAIYGPIYAARKKSGYNSAPEDIMIAAIAMRNKFAVVTRNGKDFSGITRLRVVNPWRRRARAV